MVPVFVLIHHADIRPPRQVSAYMATMICKVSYKESFIDVAWQQVEKLAVQACIHLQKSCYRWGNLYLVHTEDMIRSTMAQHSTATKCSATAPVDLACLQELGNQLSGFDLMVM